MFLSLHRSEGFGRGMAEALQLGVDMIATDFGRYTDFCSGPLAHPVRWCSAPIPRGAYPCADSHRWAEPDLEQAAELCRQVAERRFGVRWGDLATAMEPQSLSERSVYSRATSF